MKRVFLIVLDSCGAGELPDAELFGDKGAHTLKSCYNTGKLNVPNMLKLGLGNVKGLEFLGENPDALGAYCKIKELSMGKDTTIGHWEMSGVISPNPLPTYPNGFPKEVLDEFSKATGRGVLCNLPYSGTDVIRDYGDEHVKTGDLIVYTSADSVFQIAAHESVVPIEQLYEYCRIARRILCGEHAVGRVIARPFTGESGNYTRTTNRHDFSLEPYGKTMLDAIKENGKDVIAVGKITDIFAGRGVTESIFTHGNLEGMEVTLAVSEKDFNGLAFTNLVDFDMVYGHRNDANGYTEALNEFDSWLGGFITKLQPEDILIVTADHGCDPGDISTDHTREYIPMLAYGDAVKATNLGVLGTYADISATICEYLDVPFVTQGKSFLKDILK